MKQIQHNNSWSVTKASFIPEMHIIENNFEVQVILDSELHAHIDPEEIGVLFFHEVYAYAICKDPVKPALVGNVYERKGGFSNEDFPENKVLIDAEQATKKLKWFQIYLKEGVLEVLADEMRFSYDEFLEEELEERYPKGYLSHFLSIFTSQFDKAIRENFLIYMDLYVQMEKKALPELKKEVKLIAQHNDQSKFLKIVHRKGMAKMGLQQMGELFKIIEKYK